MMPFAGEQRYRETLARAEGHEGDSAMVKVADLKSALGEIEQLRELVADVNAHAVEEIERWGRLVESAFREGFSEAICQESAQQFGATTSDVGQCWLASKAAALIAHQAAEAA